MSTHERDGQRRFPEEAQPRGHDAELTPAPNAKDIGVRRGAAPANAGAQPSPAPSRRVSQRAVDAAFLVKGFGIPPGKSAALVDSDGNGTGATTESEVRQLLAEDDPLKDVPTPEEPASDLTTDTDEHRLKPVLHTQPNRHGGNPKSRIRQ